MAAPVDSIDEDVGFIGDFIRFFPDADHLDYWEINGGLTWDISAEGTVIPFLLGGLNIARLSADADDEIDERSDTELGLNLGAGLKFTGGTLDPLVGARIELSGGEGLVIFGSLPLAVGS